MSVSYGNWGLSWADSAIKYCTVHEHVEKKVPFWQLIPHAMVSLSKPMWSSPEEMLSAKRKRVLNSKLASKDNVHQDAVKRWKLHTTHPKTNNFFHSSTQNSKSSTTSKQHSSSRQVSVEEADNEIDITASTGTPKNPNIILDDSDSEIEYVGGGSQDPIQPLISDNEGEEDHDGGDNSKRMTHKSLKKSCRRKWMSRSLVN